MAKVKSIIAREILDSRGSPTVETTVLLEDGSRAEASIPSGASTGAHEALELRDNDPSRYNGLGVLKSVANVNEIIAPKVIGMDAKEQTKIDQLMIELDGTKNKSKLGANSILSVSQGICEASAVSYKMPNYKYISYLFGINIDKLKMPIPTFNIINGGKHGSGNLNFQEFHVIPSSKYSYHEALRVGEEIYQEVKKVLKHRGAIYSVGDEGGFAPNLFTNLDALEVLKIAIGQTSFLFGRDVFLGLDVASSEFYKNGKYEIKDRASPMSTDELIEYYHDLNDQYHLYILEDPLEEDAWDGWVKLTLELGEKIVIIGDDLLCTQLERTKKAVETKACTGILIKPNQVGTILETIAVVREAKKSGLKINVSHRSGETNDDFIADFAVGVGADFIKFGAPARGERVTKYNRLLKIEEELNTKKT
jgi:enolase